MDAAEQLILDREQRQSQYPIDVLVALDDMTPEQRATFESIVHAGAAAPRLAVMLAMRKFCATRSDVDLMRDFGPNGKQFERMPWAGDKIVAACREKDPNFSPVGKVFWPDLVRPETGGISDPDCWVPAGEGATGHIKDVCKKRGYAMSNGISKFVEPPPLAVVDVPYRVADSLVDRQAVKEMRENPNLSVNEAREKARDAITPEGMTKPITVLE